MNDRSVRLSVTTHSNKMLYFWVGKITKPTQTRHYKTERQTKNFKIYLVKFSFFLTKKKGGKSHTKWQFTKKKNLYIHKKNDENKISRFMKNIFLSPKSSQFFYRKKK
eukprot:817075_1